MPEFWIIYTSFALAFGITMGITVVPKINLLIAEKRNSTWRFWNSVTFFVISTIFMPIISLYVMTDTESFIKGYAGALNED